MLVSKQGKNLKDLLVPLQCLEKIAGFLVAKNNPFTLRKFGLNLCLLNLFLVLHY